MRIPLLVTHTHLENEFFFLIYVLIKTNVRNSSEFSSISK